jgi:dihydrofolate reductase
VIFVVAHDRRGIIGRAGGLPWHLPADLQHFRELTMGKPVIMGRRTFESLRDPLKGRRNIVLTRGAPLDLAGVESAASVEDVLRNTADVAEIAVIGGAQIFAAFSGYVDTAYVTEVLAQVDGDVQYIAPSRPATMHVLGEHAADERNQYAMRFLRYDYTNAAAMGGSQNESKPSV